MIFGVGVDMVKVSRIRAGLERFGDRFARRILSDSEFDEFQRSGRPAAFLAKRFAAKEAAAKALGTGFRNGLTLRQISVVHDPRGKPELRYTGCASALLQTHEIGESHLSITDEEDYALAFVALARDLVHLPPSGSSA